MALLNSRVKASLLVCSFASFTTWLCIHMHMHVSTRSCTPPEGLSAPCALRWQTIDCDRTTPAVHLCPWQKRRYIGANVQMEGDEIAALGRTSASLQSGCIAHQIRMSNFPLLSHTVTRIRPFINVTAWSLGGDCCGRCLRVRGGS
jgi:hypothetical protein